MKPAGHDLRSDVARNSSGFHGVVETGGTREWSVRWRDVAGCDLARIAIASDLFVGLASRGLREEILKTIMPSKYVVHRTDTSRLPCHTGTSLTGRVPMAILPHKSGQLRQPISKDTHLHPVFMVMHMISLGPCDRECCSC